MMPSRASSGGRFRPVHFAVKYGGAHVRPANNKEVLVEAHGLKFGEAILLFQNRLDVPLGDWALRGDVDLIKVSRSDDGVLDVLIADTCTARSWFGEREGLPVTVCGGLVMVPAGGEFADGSGDGIARRVRGYY